LVDVSRHPHFGFLPYFTHVSIILLLLVVVLWMAGETTGDTSPPVHLRLGLAGFFGFYILLVLLMGAWSRNLAKHVEAFNLHRSLRRFQKMMTFARLMIPLAFGLGVFWLGWGWIVQQQFGSDGSNFPIKLPGVVIGISPAILAWMGLWWSQYPADRAIREQSLLIQLDAGVPIQAPPRFLRYVAANFRLQVMFAILPVLLVIAMRDAIVLGVRFWNPQVEINDTVDSIASMIALAFIYVIAPVILTRVLDTVPLPQGQLRSRLTALCDRTGLKAREILVWRTNSLMGNAAVMGLFPRVRFILMTDLLLETMTDEQIEAVFAHEIGHIKHRHLLWYIAIVAIFALVSMGPGDWLDKRLVDRLGQSRILEVSQIAISLALFWVGFGFVSRRFERQADVYAARTVQRSEDTSGDTLETIVPVPGRLEFSAEGVLVAATGATLAPVLARSSPMSVVGPYGATLFASALKRVAAINNIPVSKREWIHGSIASRMDFIQSLAVSPERTAEFDRAMSRLYLTLILLVVASAGLLWAMK
jgi:STE24 endopeptidase